MPPRHQGTCTACQKVARLERHHITPRRFFGNGNHNHNIVLLCSGCHRDIEALIPQEQVKPRYWYFAIVAKFIKEKNDAV